MLLTLIVFLAILSVLIFVHELGHFLVAKRAGIKVEEFGFGLPPRLLGVNYKGTIYSVNLLPIGGFVRLYGEDFIETEKLKNLPRRQAGEKTEEQFWNKPKKVRAAVTIAGVMMNFLLAVVLFSFLYTKLGIPTESDQVKILGVIPSSPAAQAGLKEGDLVLAIEGEPIRKTKEFIHLTQKYVGEEINLEISRAGESLFVAMTPRREPPEGEGPLGIVISSMELKFYPFWQMPARGALEGMKESLAWTALIVGGLGKMLSQLLFQGAVPADVAGPVGIFQLTGQVAKTGALAVLQFLGILSINLAVINILPIPALDGGRLLFIGIEAVSGKRVRTKVEAYAHQIGMVFLLLLVLLITLNDVRRLLGNFSPLDWLRRIF